MDRTILHCDLNNCYASIECLYHPEIRRYPVAVCGDVENRHGIVLAKNYRAKAYGVKTGDPLFQAKQKCPGLVMVPPNYDLYLRYAQLTRQIYYDYSEQVEAFGLDECWVDVTGSAAVRGDGEKIANEIRKRIKFELGVTASVGVSFNKIFAKLGSDMRKPDATTTIYRNDFHRKVWPLPVNDLLYVGRATHRKLYNYGIVTIGDLARANVDFLKFRFGKPGVMLWTFANGLDNSPVCNIEAAPLVKSIGNSTTAPHDLVTDDDVRITLYVLSESVAERLRDSRLRCRTVQISIRDNDLFSFERQAPACPATSTAKGIFDVAYDLYLRHRPEKPLRSMGLRACNLESDERRQLSFLPEQATEEKMLKMEYIIDNLRYRFGHHCIKRGIMLMDRRLSAVDPKNEHTIYPESFLRKKM